MAGPNASRKRNGRRSACSYCGRTHRHGKKSDSCKGHAVRTMHIAPQRETSETPVYRSEPSRATTHPHRRARIERARQRNARPKRSAAEQLTILDSRPGNATRERERLRILAVEQEVDEK